jgi:hypothetical protein
VNGSPQRRMRRKRLWLAAAVVLCGAVVAVVAVATRGFGLIDSEQDSNQAVAADRCQSEVMKRLAEPSAATLSGVKTETSVLDPDSRDLFSLLDDPLKGVDQSRITVWNVSGVVEAPGAAGTVHDRFDCRAYFVDGSVQHTLVLFDHDH